MRCQFRNIFTLSYIFGVWIGFNYDVWQLTCDKYNFTKRSASLIWGGSLHLSWHYFPWVISSYLPSDEGLGGSIWRTVCLFGDTVDPHCILKTWIYCWHVQHISSRSLPFNGNGYNATFDLIFFCQCGPGRRQIYFGIITSAECCVFVLVGLCLTTLQKRPMNFACEWIG